MVRFRTSAAWDRLAESNHFVLVRDAYASRYLVSDEGLSTPSLMRVLRDGGISLLCRYMSLYIFDR